MYSFDADNNDLFYPINGVTLSSGYLYGVTISGGANGQGGIYKVSTSGSGFALLDSDDSSSSHDYNFVDSPLVVSGSTIYGISYDGGTNGYGLLFSLTTSGGSYKSLYTFDPNGSYSGCYGEGIALGKDGNLYGTTGDGGTDGNGTVFKYNVSGKSISDLYDFTGGTDGAFAYSGLTQDPNSGLLYGTTASGGANGYGTAYQVSTSGSLKTIAALASVEASSANNGYDAPPTLSSGILYDIANEGGANSNGSVYKLATASPYALSLVYDFGNGFHDGLYPSYGNLLAGGDGMLHGTTADIATNNGNGSVCHISTTGTNYEQDTLVSGSPYGALIQAADGSYVGTTYNAGTYNEGTVFSFISGESSSYEDDYDYDYDFGEAAGSNLPTGVILGSDGNYYGISYSGGRYNDGCVFKLTPDGYETVIYSFKNTTDGNNPMGQLVEDAAGNFYGTTLNGGAHGYGTVFKLSPTNQLTTLLAFDYSMYGANPQAGVILSGSTLYGTAQGGGANGQGTVYSVSTSGTSPKAIHGFSDNGTDGYQPYAGVTIGTDGRLYGTCYEGGANQCGIVYSIAASTGSESILHSFNATGMTATPPAAVSRKRPTGTSMAPPTMAASRSRTIQAATSRASFTRCRRCCPS